METLNFLASWAQILSLPIAVIAIIVSVWLFYKSKQRRAIACIFDQIESPLEIKAGKALDGAIEILYNGKSVQNIFLIRFKIQNVGNLPIRQSDVINPLTFTFEPDVVILREPHVIEKKPLDLGIKWGVKKTGRKEISFLFDLLNPGDEVLAEFLCAGDAKLPKIVARIEGVGKIDTIDPEEKRLKKGLIEALWVPIAFVLVLLLQEYPVSAVKLPAPVWLVISVIFGLGIIVLFILVVWALFLRPVVQYAQYRLRKRRRTEKA